MTQPLQQQGWHNNCDIERAVAIRVGRRWFCRVAKGRVLTAWSLAGAQLFGSWQKTQIGEALGRIRKAGRDGTEVVISVEFDRG